MDDVFCNGNEQALINCSHRGIGVHGCTHSEDAGVKCLGKGTLNWYNDCIDSVMIILS